MSPPIFNRFIWHDLMTTDIERAVDFYIGLFGWAIQAIDTGAGLGTYRMIHAATRAIGGFVSLDARFSRGSHWMGYAAVEDVDSAVNAAGRAGAFVEIPPTDLESVGRFAVVADTGGAAFAPLQPVSSPEPPQKSENGQFCWNELRTDAPDASRAIYSAAMGWEARRRDLEELGEYTVFTTDGTDVAGMKVERSTADRPACWLPYVRVMSVGDSAARVEQLGGSMVLLPTKVDSIGTVAVAIDPSGARFGLHRPER
jgi:predicted enzyme related to lactoylglutathione lyase